MSDIWVVADKPLVDYPLGTKAQADGGGYWIKVTQGWKWCSGSTFPSVGGDWNGKVATIGDIECALNEFK